MGEKLSIVYIIMFDGFMDVFVSAQGSGFVFVIPSESYFTKGLISCNYF